MARLEEYVDIQKGKAEASRKQYLQDFESRRSSDPEYREKKRIEAAQRRQLKKEQLRSEVIN